MLGRKKTTSDKTVAEAQQVFDSNLGEQSGDGKRSIYINVDGNFLYLLLKFISHVLMWLIVI